MQNQAEYLLVMSACPDIFVAKKLANHILDQKLAACVNIVPQVISLYEWEGKREQSNECLLLMKTRQEKYDALQACIVQEHPYELPEVVAVRISDALPAYAAWISKNLK